MQHLFSLFYMNLHNNKPQNPRLGRGRGSPQTPKHENKSGGLGGCRGGGSGGFFVRLRSEFKGFLGFKGLGFRGFRVQGLGFRVLGFRVSGFQGSGFRV